MAVSLEASSKGLFLMQHSTLCLLPGTTNSGHCLAPAACSLTLQAVVGLTDLPVQAGQKHLPSCFRSIPHDACTDSRTSKVQAHNMCVLGAYPHLWRCDAPPVLRARPGPAQEPIHTTLCCHSAGGVGMQVGDMAAALEHALQRTPPRLSTLTAQAVR